MSFDELTAVRARTETHPSRSGNERTAFNRRRRTEMLWTVEPVLPQRTTYNKARECARRRAKP